MDRRQRRLLVRLALAAAVAVMIVARYTSPKSIFQPLPDAADRTSRSRP